MRKYLQSLPSRSPEHKSRFALLTSGAITLVIFALWALVHFGAKPDLATNDSNTVNLAGVASTQISPAENILGGFKDIWYSLTHLNGR